MATYNCFHNKFYSHSECENLQEEVRELLLEKDENQHVTRLIETQKSILEEKVWLIVESDDSWLCSITR